MNEALLQEKTKDVEHGFEPYMPKEEGYASTLLEAVNYSIRAGGKRLRPLFMQASYAMFGGDEEGAIRPFMMAIEMIHTYSLVHDDLPAMDNDDYRRGKLTTHKKYGEAMGILSGDALLNLAYETACQAFDSDTDASLVGEALRILGRKSGIYGMVGGQTVDVENNGRYVDEDTLLYVYKNKTAALMEASLMIGAVLAGALPDDVKRMEAFGECIGISFQIQDDILDEEGDEKTIGKPLHSDAKNEKSTYTAIYGIDESKKQVKAYTMRGIGILQKTAWKKREDMEFLRDLAESLVGRNK